MKMNIIKIIIIMISISMLSSTFTKKSMRKNSKNTPTPRNQVWVHDASLKMFYMSQYGPGSELNPRQDFRICKSAMIRDKNDVLKCATCPQGKIANEAGNQCIDSPPGRKCCNDSHRTDLTKDCDTKNTSSDPNRIECHKCPPGEYATIDGTNCMSQTSACGPYNKLGSDGQCYHCDKDQQGLELFSNHLQQCLHQPNVFHCKGGVTQANQCSRRRKR